MFYNLERIYINMKKKYFALISIIVLMVSMCFTACGSKDGNGKDISGSDSESTSDLAKKDQKDSDY